MINQRYQPKHYEESTKHICAYCHRTPAVWQQSGNEKICAHCGTRVYNSMPDQDENAFAKSTNR